MISNPFRRAFTLVEMLVVISIMAIALVIEVRVFKGSMDVIHTSDAAENQINSLNRITSKLRQDVWSAASIEMPDSRTILLSRPDGSTARWRLSDSEMIRETDPADAPVQQKWEVSLPLQARHEGATIVLQAISNQNNTGTEIRFISQVMLARGNP